MPAETIHDLTGVFDARVAWGTYGTHVQLSTQYGQSGPQHIVAIVNEWLTACGEPAIDFDKIRNLPTEMVPGRRDAPHYDGVHVTLDRDQINKLIKILRRARDSVYGSDE
jgi:hypothetical protein